MTSYDEKLDKKAYFILKKVGVSLWKNGKNSCIRDAFFVPRKCLIALFPYQQFTALDTKNINDL